MAEESGNDPLLMEEMEVIRAAHGGYLDPHDVVEFARNRNTKLHNEFDWVDSSAAAKYRLQQARKLIKFFRVEVEIAPRKMISVPMYSVAGMPPRDGERHYQKVVEILSDAELKRRYVSAGFSRAIAILRNVAHPVAQREAERLQRLVDREFPAPK